jgi:hypothetical protein
LFIYSIFCKFKVRFFFFKIRLYRGTRKRENTTLFVAVCFCSPFPPPPLALLVTQRKERQIGGGGGQFNLGGFLCLHIGTFIQLVTGYLPYMLMCLGPPYNCAGSVSVRNTGLPVQEWVLGPACGLGGFGELYLAARRLPDGSISPQHFVIKVTATITQQPSFEKSKVKSSNSDKNTDPDPVIPIPNM